MIFASQQVSEELIREGETREVFWNFPTWLEVVFYVLAFASVLVFCYGCARAVAKYRRGRGGKPPPFRELPRRFLDALRIVLSQASIRKRDGYAGWAHAAIFYGFITLAIGTTILAINTDITERFFGWRFFTGTFYRAYSIVLDLMGVALLGGVLAMMFRRAVIRPRTLDYERPDRPPEHPQQDRRQYRWGDWIFVAGLLYLVLSGFMLEGARIAMDQPEGSEYSPAGWAAGQLVSGLSTSSLEVLRMSLWWAHALVALTVVAAIPYTKAVHMLSSFASLVMRDPQAGKRLAPIPPERETLPAGYGTLGDLSIKHLLDLDACTKCGKCHVACPANATGLPLSPRDVILELREVSNGDAQGMSIGGVLGSLYKNPHGESDATLVGDDRVREDTIWSCMQCNACVEACPVGIEQAPIINQMRRRLVEEGEMPPDLQKTLQTVQRSGNSFGENKRRRGSWTKELEFEVVDARKEPVDVLWFVGDYASFDPRSQRVTRTLARIFRAAGVSFGILYDGERNAGNDVRRAGEEGLWEALASHNIGVLEGAEFNRIVTSDPHTLNTLRHEYPDLGATWHVCHHTTYLLELIESGRLDVAGHLDFTVTYHDPCYLGRHTGEYDSPRRILELLGLKLIEMPRNRDNSFCCGAGGGRIWMSEPAGSERPSENRIREALGLGDPDYFVVSCPKDVTMYEDAIKTTGSSDRIELRELTELVYEATLGDAVRPQPVGVGVVPESDSE